MIVQLNPSIPVHVMDKGSGEAFALIDYGKEDHVLWGVALDAGGEVWWVSNENVRFMRNYSVGRTKE